MTPFSRLDLYLNGRLVGYLDQGHHGPVSFSYDKAYLGWIHALPVSLSLPLQEKSYTGARVAAVFENLLPDNEDIREAVAARVRARGVDAFSLLSAIGRDCVGALQFLPHGQTPAPLGNITGRKLTPANIRKIIGSLGRAPLGITEGEDFRISIAGAQEKTAFLRWDGEWRQPEGTTPTTHIFKPHMGLRRDGLDLSQSVENEYLCLKLAKAFGFETANAAIRSFAGEKVLVVERFDRIMSDDRKLYRLPQEDLCQALSVPPHLKYERDGGPGIARILDLLKAANDPAADRMTFIKAQIFFWALGATDGHAKNFSIFLEPGGAFRLAPLYDILSAQPNVDAGQVSQNKMTMAMTVGTGRHYVVKTIVPRHFVESAREGGMGASIVREAMAQLTAIADRAIPSVSKKLPKNFPVTLRNSILGGLEKRLAEVNTFLN